MEMDGRPDREERNLVDDVQYLDGVARAVAGRIWDAYIPFKRGRDVSRDLTIILALVALSRWIDGRERGDARQWDLAVHETTYGRSPWQTLQPLLRSFQREVRALEGPLSSADEDAPWLPAVLEAIGQGRGAAKADRGEVFDLFLDQAMRTEQIRAGEYFTPRAICDLMAGLAAPRAGERIHDPACGAGGVLLAAARYVQNEPGGTGLVPLYAKAANENTAALAGAAFVAHGLFVNFDRHIGPPTDSRVTDSDKMDVVVSNPPFGHGRSRTEGGWSVGGNANFGWLQYGLAKVNAYGRSVMLMPSSVAFSQSSQGAWIRQTMLDDDVVACIVALPANLFEGTAIAPHLWLTAPGKRHLWPDRRGQVLFVDAREATVSAGRGDLTFDHRQAKRIARCFSAWAGTEPDYADEAGFCRSATYDDIERADFNLDPALFVTPLSTGSARTASSASELLDELGELGRRLEHECVQARADILVHTSSRPVQPGPAAGGPGRAQIRLLAEVLAGAKLRDKANPILAGPSGALLKASDYAQEGGIPVIMPRDLGDNVILADRAARVSAAKANELRRFQLEPGDVVVARRGEIGRRAIVDGEQGALLCGTGCIRIRPGEAIDPAYLAAYLGRPEVRAWLTRHEVRSVGMSSINVAILERLPILLPPRDVQQSVRDVVARLDKQRKLLQRAQELADRVRSAAFLEVLGCEVDLG